MKKQSTADSKQKNLFAPLQFDKELANELNAILGKITKRLPSITCFENHANDIAQLLRLISCDEEIKSKLNNIVKDDKEQKFAVEDHVFFVLSALIRNAMKRPKDVERGDNDDLDSFVKNRKIFLSLFSNIGFTQAHDLGDFKPKIMIVQSGFGFRLWRRCEFLIEVLHEHKPTHIHVAAGDRKLLDDKRDKGFLMEEFADKGDDISTLKTEKDQSEFILKQLSKKYPNLFENIKLSYGAAEARESNPRADSEDTSQNAMQMLEIKEGDKIAVISDPPYLSYHCERFRLSLGVGENSKTELVAIGPSALKSYPILDFYDALSRLFDAISKRILHEHYAYDISDAQQVMDGYAEKYPCISDISKRPVCDETAGLPYRLLSKVCYL